MSNTTRVVAGTIFFGFLTACGGGGGSGASSTPTSGPTNQSPGGIWQTSYTVTSGANTGDLINVVAIVSENGSLYFAARNQNNGCAEIGFGQAAVSGTAISGSLVIAVVKYTTSSSVNVACAYPDGATSGTGTFTGSVTERTNMTLTVTGTTSSGMALPAETYTWSFNSTLYDTPSSLASVAGNYTDGSDTLSINANGAIFLQDPTTGCVINGQASIIHASYNVYSFAATYGNCTGSASSANGQTLTGLAMLDQTVSPAQLDYGASINANGQILVLVGVDPKQ